VKGSLQDDTRLINIISSKGKVKILKLLLHEGQVNISRIVKETGLHYNLVIKHLSELISLGIVEEQRIGRLRMYSLRFDNPRTLALVEALKLLDEL